MVLLYNNKAADLFILLEDRLTGDSVLDQSCLSRRERPALEASLEASGSCTRLTMKGMILILLGTAFVNKCLHQVRHHHVGRIQLGQRLRSRSPHLVGLLLPLNIQADRHWCHVLQQSDSLHLQSLCSRSTMILHVCRATTSGTMIYGC